MSRRPLAEAPKSETLLTNEAIVIHMPKLIAIRRLQPDRLNPRKITAKDFETLKLSIRKNGFIDPICVQKKGLTIIGGHQRVRALKEICVEIGLTIPDVPCIVLDISDRDARQLNVMLNNVSGEFDARLLGELLASMNKEAPLTVIESSFMGFEQTETDRYLRLVDAIPPLPTNGITTFGSSVTLSLTFKDTRLRDAVRKAIMEKAEVSKQTTGEFVASLLKVKVA